MEMPNNCFFDDSQEAQHQQKCQRSIKRRDNKRILRGKTIAKSEPTPNQQEFGADESLGQREQPRGETYPFGAQDGGLKSSERAEANKKIGRKNCKLSQFNLDSLSARQLYGRCICHLSRPALGTSGHDYLARRHRR